MSANNLTTTYRLLNSSFRKTMIFHLGIDAGFFTEYTYMLHAMLYCLNTRYSSSSIPTMPTSVGRKVGQTVSSPSVRKCTKRFTTPTTPTACLRGSIDEGQEIAQDQTDEMETESTCKNITGETLAFLTYKKPVLLNCHLKFDPNQHFHIPELGIDGDYLHAFRKMTEITWKLNEVTGRECRHLADNLQLPQEYVGCQIRGGDKVTETNLLPAEYYIRLIKQKTDLRDVFVLTDDYRIFRQVQSLAPDIRWYTLCDSGEKGYVNSAFTQTTKELKQKQMTRFLSSIQVLMNASIFTGSITTGPSLFLLKKFYPDISPADCLLEDFPQAATLPIPGRSQMAAEFLQGNLKL